MRRLGVTIDFRSKFDPFKVSKIPSKKRIAIRGIFYIIRFHIRFNKDITYVVVNRINNPVPDF